MSVPFGIRALAIRQAASLASLAMLAIIAAATAADATLNLLVANRLFPDEAGVAWGVGAVVMVAGGYLMMHLFGIFEKGATSAVENGDMET